ncbi:hypothetical protein ACQCN2_05960 [Brevibacillus ginsengisoli]
MNMLIALALLFSCTSGISFHIKTNKASTVLSPTSASEILKEKSDFFVL